MSISMINPTPLPPAGPNNMSPVPRDPEFPDASAVTPPPVGLQGADATRARNRDDAVRDYGTMQQTMLDGRDGRVTAREHANSDSAATAWPHGQLAAAAMDRALVTGDTEEARKALAGLDAFERDGTFNPTVGHNTQDRFYDDNAWIGLDYAQAFRMTGDQKYVDGARRTFDFLMQGTHADGGVYWKENAEPKTRNACTNGPAQQLALQLYDLTGEQRYLDEAKKIDTALTSLRREDGLLIDNVDDSGKREGTIWSYNQGAAIGADLQMFEATGDTAKLDRAKSTASAALAYFNEDDRLWKQPPAFNAVLFRNLLQLDRIAPDPQIRATLDRYLDRARTQARDGEGFYTGGGIGRYDGKAEDGAALIDQSAFVQMHALLAMTPEQLATVS